jgi:hypothetical protein
MPKLFDHFCFAVARLLGRRPTYSLMAGAIIAGASVVSAGNASAASFCAYNKTRQQAVVIVSDKNSLTLSAGSHFCCKPNDALCGNTGSSAADGRGVTWRIEANIGGRLAWCGDPTRKNNNASNGIALTAADSYLLIRDLREATMPPRPTVTPTPTLPPSSVSAPSTALRAPLIVDLMSADGKVVGTSSCQFNG